MAAPTLTQIMAGIETRLKTISGLRTSPFTPPQVNPPQAWVSVPEILYYEAFQHGTMRITPSVTVVLPSTVDRIDQPALSTYMDIAGANSIFAAIEGDRTLALAGVDCFISGSRESDIQIAGVYWYGAVFTLHVVAKGV